MEPVFGVALDDHLRATNLKIALPIQICVSALLKVEKIEKGLFTSTCDDLKLRNIKLSLDAGCSKKFSAVLECKDPNAIACALKAYLGALPEPVMTFK